MPSLKGRWKQTATYLLDQLLLQPSNLLAIASVHAFLRKCNGTDHANSSNFCKTPHKRIGRLLSFMSYQLINTVRIREIFGDRFFEFVIFAKILSG